MERSPSLNNRAEGEALATIPVPVYQPSHHPQAGSDPRRRAAEAAFEGSCIRHPDAQFEDLAGLVSIKSQHL